MQKPLDYERAWALLHNGSALSAARGGEHLFSFRLRLPGGSVTWAVRVLFDGKYELAGWRGAGSPELMVRDAEIENPIIGCAGAYHPTVRKVHRIFNRYLLKEAVPEEIDLVPAREFERERCLAFMAEDADMYRYLGATSDQKLSADCLTRIGNCGEITEGQRRLVVERMKVWVMRKQFTDARQRRAAKSGQARRDEDAIGDEELTDEAKRRADEKQAEVLRLRKVINDDPA